MTIDTIVHNFRDKVCDQVQLAGDERIFYGSPLLAVAGEGECRPGGVNQPSQII